MKDKLDEVFSNYIGRIVTFVLMPLLLVAVPPVTNAINEVLGTGYSDQQISNVAVATIVGLAVVAWQWVRNRGDWEKVVAELHTLYESGEKLMADGLDTGQMDDDEQMGTTFAGDRPDSGPGLGEKL